MYKSMGQVWIHQMHARQIIFAALFDPGGKVLHAHTYVCTCMHTYIYMFICTHVVLTYMHAYVHTHAYCIHLKSREMDMIYLAVVLCTYMYVNKHVNNACKHIIVLYASSYRYVYVHIICIYQSGLLVVTVS